MQTIVNICGTIMVVAVTVLVVIAVPIALRMLIDIARDEWGEEEPKKWIR